MKQKIMIGCLATLLTIFTNSTNATVPSCRENQKEKVESTFVSTIAVPIIEFTFYFGGCRYHFKMWTEGKLLRSTFEIYDQEYGTLISSQNMQSSLTPANLSGFVIDESTIEYTFDSDEDKEFFYSIEGLERELIDQVNAHLEDLD